ncbi:hypothetical protein PN441_14025 [Spirulina major CS-329]|uniref:hypothetical protein n=1 Tax=Spirulina TaxID=1154 RepID=UPI00232B660D|nr:MULTISPECIES: hypothetical protein [Spirulina]MDB9496685.1 hypothetical protein [Spirulina subsalsa CS-330]MDB9504190.1 hypothetical protein [Spirulina major CS-329]
MSPPSRPIDLTCDYPCPCRRGRLQRITLTDAFGCDRCQHLFEVTEQGMYLEQIVTTRPQRPRWRWTGKTWKSVPRRDPLHKFTTLELFGLLLGTIVCVLILNQAIANNLVYGLCLLILLIVIPGLMFWLSYRQ